MRIQKAFSLFSILLSGFIIDAVSTSALAETMSVFETRVVAAGDDAEQRSDGRMSLYSSDLDMVYDGKDQLVGIRFRNIAIPKNAQIEDAFLQFAADETGTSTSALTIQGEAASNAAAYSITSGNIARRARTAAAVSWAPAAWSRIGVAGAAQRTPSLKPILQEIVNQGGWDSGNSISFIITGKGKRSAESYEGKPTAAPRLRIAYSIKTPSQPAPAPDPVATTTTDVAIAPAPTPDTAACATTTTTEPAPVPGTDTAATTTTTGPAPVPVAVPTTEPVVTTEPVATVTPEPTPVLRQAVLAWAAPTTRENNQPLSIADIAGYELYMTNETTEKVVVINDALLTAYTFQNLTPGTYHFAASTVDTGGHRSQLSNVVSITIQ